jgi:hypothetical protein
LKQQSAIRVLIKDELVFASTSDKVVIVYHTESGSPIKKICHGEITTAIVVTSERTLILGTDRGLFFFYKLP